MKSKYNPQYIKKAVNYKQRPYQREHTDADYLNKLSPEELEWLRRFTAEEYGASIKKDRSLMLQQNESELKRINQETYARSQDVYSKYYRVALPSKDSEETLGKLQSPRVNKKQKLGNMLVDEMPQGLLPAHSSRNRPGCYDAMDWQGSEHFTLEDKVIEAIDSGLTIDLAIRPEAPVFKLRKRKTINKEHKLANIG